MQKAVLEKVVDRKKSFEENLLFWPAKTECSVSQLPLVPEEKLPSHLHPVIPLLEELELISNSIRELQGVNHSKEQAAAVQHLTKRSADLIYEISSSVKGHRERQILRKKADVLLEQKEAKSVLEEASRLVEQELVLLCGPLSTWYQKSTKMFHSFVAAVPDKNVNEKIAQADELFHQVLPYLRDLLGNQEILVGDIPLFVSGDLIACGGEANRFPKHFSYFLPEDENVKWASTKKTVLFQNLYTHRFLHTTRPLFYRIARGFSLEEIQENTLTTNLVMWLRGHDIGHSILLPSTDYKALRQIGRWNSMLVQEAIADVYGLMMKTSPYWKDISQTPDDTSASLYAAELIRYVTRGVDVSPDAGAAYLQLSFLAGEGYFTLDHDNIEIHGSADSLLVGIKELTKILTHLVLTPNVDALLEFLEKYIGRSEHAAAVKSFVTNISNKAKDIPFNEAYIRV